MDIKKYFSSKLYDIKTIDRIERMIQKINDNKNQIIIFVGAGLSKLCGLPLWDDLAYILLKKCYDDMLISFIEYDDMKNKSSYNSKLLISIIYNKYNQIGKEEKFYEILKEELTLKKENPNYIRIVEIIKKIGPIIITTNADEILDVCVDPENVVFGNKLIDMPVDEINDMFKNFGTKVFHIHGSIKQKKENGLIFTTKQYIDMYNNKEFQKKIETLLMAPNMPILFIGTSMSELELLQYILNKKNNSDRYILNGYYNYQNTLKEAMDQYYLDFNIKQLSYLMDKNGYDATIDFLDELANLVYENTNITINRFNSTLEKISRKNDENSIINNIINYYKSTPLPVMYEIFTKINELKNNIHIYNKLRGKCQYLFSIDELMKINDTVQKTLFIAISQLNKQKKSEYKKIKNYYIKNIGDFLKKSDKNFDSKIILYCIDMLNLEEYDDNNHIDLNFICNLFDNEKTQIHLILFELEGKEIHPKNAYFIILYLLKNNKFLIKNYESENIDFIDSQIESIINYNCINLIELTNTIIFAVNKINDFDQLIYKDLGAICDYCKTEATYVFSKKLIILFKYCIKKCDVFACESILKSLTFNKIDIKLRLYIIDQYFDNFNAELKNEKYYDTIDSFSSLCWIAIHNLNRMSYYKEDYIKIIDKSNFGQKNEDSKVLQKILINKLYNVNLPIESNSRFNNINFEDIGKSFIVHSHEKIIKEKYQYLMSKKIDDFIQEINKIRNVEFEGIIVDIIELYFNNFKNLLTFMRNPQYIVFFKKEEHYFIFKKITEEKIQNCENVICNFFECINIEFDDYFTLEKIIEKQELIKNNSLSIIKILKKIYEKEKNKNYSFDSTRCCGFLITNHLYLITRLLVECYVNQNKICNIFKLIEKNSKNSLIIKLGIISKYDLFKNDKNEIEHLIKNTIDTSDNIDTAKIYSVLLMTEIKKIDFIVDNKFISCYELIDESFRNLYNVEILINAKLISKSLLNFIMNNCSINDVNQFINHIDVKTFDREQLLLILHSILKKNKGINFIDYKIFNYVVELIKIPGDNRKIRYICQSFVKQKNVFLKFDKIVSSLIKLFDFDADFLINKIFKPIAEEYIRYQHRNYSEMYDFFIFLNGKNLSIKNHQVLKELSIKAFNNGMTKFAEFK